MTSLLTQDALAVALFIVIAFIISGTLHVFWLKLSISVPLKIPIDGGQLFRGKRIFGDNKTIRGFVIIIPATALSFYSLAAIRHYSPEWFANGIWQSDASSYLIAGFIAASGFMLGELPNSFIKRQCGIPPGEQPKNVVWRLIASIIDRMDSLVVMLFFLSLYFPVPGFTWVYMLLIGPGIHFGFSVFLFKLKVKGRPG